MLCFMPHALCVPSAPLQSGLLQDSLVLTFLLIIIVSTTAATTIKYFFIVTYLQFREVLIMRTDLS